MLLTADGTDTPFVLTYSYQAPMWTCLLRSLWVLTKFRKDTAVLNTEEGHLFSREPNSSDWVEQRQITCHRSTVETDGCVYVFMFSLQ